MAATPLEDRAIEAYGKGFVWGVTVKSGGSVSPSPDPDPNDWIGAWEAIGRRDGISGITRNRFEGITVGVSPDERRVYDQGYDGASVAVRHDWYQQGQKDRAMGRPRRYVLEQIYGDAPPGAFNLPNANGGVIVNAPPPYSPPPPYRVPNLPPVVAYPDRYPPNEGYYPPYPPRRFRRRRPGIIITGPWGEIDRTQLAAQLGQPQTVRPGDLLDTYY